MHEYPITLEIIDIAARHAKQNGYSRVLGINLVAGENCGYLSDSIALYFDIISKGGVCEGASLAFESVKPLLRCKGCGGLFLRRPFEFACPDCGDDGEPTEIGREFYIKSIECE